MQKSLGAHGGQLGAQHLDGVLVVVLKVFSEIDSCHAAGADLAVDAVAVW